MRKFKNFLFIIPAILLLTSCYKETYVPTPIDPNGAYLNTYYYNVYPSDWKQESTAEQEYWYATFSIPQITKYVIDEGMVVCYLVGNYDNILPYVAAYDDGTTFYMQTIRFDLRQGEITFVIENSDLNISRPQNNMQFKVCIVQNY